MRREASLSNQLASEQSPYLQQHAENPVDWYPWSDDALERARKEDKPILVSIGYSACHWCHVMAHESFEDEQTAALMNQRFVNIKVDREERPDVDAIYMEAVQMLTGSGGWPLNVFLTPDGRPFYGGTYFPPDPRPGLPSWTQVLESVDRAYRERREDVTHNAALLTDYVLRAQNPSSEPRQIGADVLDAALAGMLAQIDWTHGGWNGAPKFPQPLALDFLLRQHHRSRNESALRAVGLTLDRMSAGGIYDHLGGGFHRYSVDGAWIVPHFEKMLYDNALLARAYLHAHLVTGLNTYRTVVEETLDYLLREMRSPEGAFFSAQDADSEGEEGKYYVWTPDELEAALLPAQARVAMLRFGVSEQGNFEGRTILTQAKSLEDVASLTELPVNEVEVLVSEARQRLLQARSLRVEPGKDRKILTSWNALTARALAEAGRALDRPDYLGAAEEAVRFLLSALRPGGRLVRSYGARPSSVPAFLEDYAYLVEALLTLYETVSDPAYLETAEDLASEMVDRFADPDGRPFFDATDSDDLVVRPRSLFDNPIPSGNSAATLALLRLSALTGDDRYTDLALRAFGAAYDLLLRAPLGCPYLLSALDFHLGPVVQVGVVGGVDQDGLERLSDVVFHRYLPNAVVAAGSPEASPLLAGRALIDGQATAYVCHNFACRLPVTTVEGLEQELNAATETRG